MEAEWEALKPRLDKLVIKNSERKKDPEETFAQITLFNEQQEIVYNLTLLWLKGAIPSKEWI